MKRSQPSHVKRQRKRTQIATKNNDTQLVVGNNECFAVIRKRMAAPCTGGQIVAANVAPALACGVHLRKMSNKTSDKILREQWPWSEMESPIHHPTVNRRT